MTEHAAPKLAKWPFLLGDVFLVGMAAVVVGFSARPLGLWQMAACVVCVGAGAWLFTRPFLEEYQAAVKMAENNGLARTVTQIQNLETIARQIGDATRQWQTVQDLSARAVADTKEIGERMAVEAKAFTEFMQKANDVERANLRLEVDKARRAEGEWVQIVTRMLDHVFALYQAGARSGQSNLMQQLEQFQSACRDVTRRVGLAAFAAQPGEVFDEKLHQLVDTQTPPPANAKVSETIATGYTYQGQLLRRALVKVQVEPELEKVSQATSGLFSQDQPLL